MLRVLRGLFIQAHARPFPTQNQVPRVVFAKAVTCEAGALSALEVWFPFSLSSFLLRAELFPTPGRAALTGSQVRLAESSGLYGLVPLCVADLELSL